MEIVVQLRSELAQLVNRSHAPLRAAARGNAELESLAATLAQFDAELVPQHPDADQPQLQSWFTVPCGDRDVATCERIAAALLRDAAVQGAYLKSDAQPAAPM